MLVVLNVAAVDATGTNRGRGIEALASRAGRIRQAIPWKSNAEHLRTHASGTVPAEIKCRKSGQKYWWAVVGAKRSVGGVVRWRVMRSR